MYGVGGAFDKRLGKVTKVNPSKPAVEDGSGHRSCYWKLNLTRVGNVASTFGYCSICKRPSEVAHPCPNSASGGVRCQGIIQGSYNWRLQSLSTSRPNPSERPVNESMGIFLARQLGAALSRLGFLEVSDDIVEAINSGLRSSSPAPRGVAPASHSVSPSTSNLD